MEPIAILLIALAIFLHHWSVKMKPGYLTKVKVKLKFQSDVKPCGTNSVEIVDARKILLKNLLALKNVRFLV